MSTWRGTYRLIGTLTLLGAALAAVGSESATAALLMIATAGFAIAAEVARP